MQREMQVNATRRRHTNSNTPGFIFALYCRFEIINRPCLLLHVYGTVGPYNTTYLSTVIYWSWPIQCNGPCKYTPV